MRLKRTTEDTPASQTDGCLAPNRPGRSGAILRSDAFAIPTAIAALDDRMLVVNGQLDKMGRVPQLPFTVVAIDAVLSS
jgi:hypothetical protein